MAGHSHFSPANVEEFYEFTPEARKRVITAMIIGAVLLGIGVFFLGSGEHEAAHAVAGHAAEHGGEHLSGGAVSHHESPWNPLNRLWVNLWMNGVFFSGIAVIGMFFVAVQYLAKAGWSSVVKRIPEAFPKFLYFTFPVLLLLFIFKGDVIFHWMHHGITDPASEHYDKIIAGKKGYLNFTFFLVRLVAIFTVWIVLWNMMRKKSIEEDLNGGTQNFFDMVRIGTGFVVAMGISSSLSAWDWVMSIDTHWFSTMFGWYMFSSWHVTGLATITLTVLFLKDKGYMQYVSDSHLHDLGKFMFAFSIFWTYVWFAQFLLIYYANMPEETIYFLERWEGHNKVYKAVEILNVFMNFFFPFLIMMTRDAKRTPIFLKICCFFVIVGHYLDFYQMIMPGTVGPHGGFGLVEFGTVILFASAFVYVVSTELTKASLVAKNHPLLEESLHHDI